jgi:hypothetical protein
MMVCWQLSVRRYLTLSTLLFSYLCTWNRLFALHFEFLTCSLYFVDQVHMEVERKAMVNQANVPADRQFQSRTTYRIKNKVTLFSRVYISVFVHSSSVAGYHKDSTLCCSLSLVVDICCVAANGFVLVSKFLCLGMLQPYRWPPKLNLAYWPCYMYLVTCHYIIIVE